MIEIDKRFNETFRFGGNKMSSHFKRQPEWKFIVTYRKFQANADNVLGVYYRWRLTRIERQTGIHIENNSNIGKGLIIGHYGRIIINGKAKFGEQIYITHGVTIGQNSTGKRKGVPEIGNRVRIGANACIVGNVRIGDDVMVAPNAFVNVDVPDHSVVVGNPCVIHHKENATKGYLGEID
ncbi:serine acetyltransferase [Phocaeicola vulgatus]|nr:serine acetyltransferase [Phocaeicola vulgatus]